MNHDIDASRSLLHAAGVAAGGQEYPQGALYVVATPIGNLADLSLRAIHVFALVDAVACEDTRVTGALLHRLGLDKPLVAVHQHNEREASSAVLARLAAGERVAYASDAGTPAISDPGAVLVDAVAGAGHRVLPIPGPSSVAALLSVAGDAGAAAAGRGDAEAAGYRFVGFVASRGRERQTQLDAIAADAQAVVLFEAPHRIEALAADLAARVPARRVTVGRELTKQFETVATMAAAELPGWLAADTSRRRGEFVLALHASPRPAVDDAVDARALKLLGVLLRELPLKQAVALAAEAGGGSRNALYAAALAQRGATQGEPMQAEAAQGERDAAPHHSPANDAPD